MQQAVREIIERSGKTTTCVIDHLGHNDGDGSDAEFKRWADDLEALGALKMEGGAELVAKLGAIEEWGVGSPEGDGVARMLDHALAIFGFGRVMYESNWFVCAAYGEEKKPVAPAGKEAAAAAAAASSSETMGKKQTRASYDATARAILSALERAGATDADVAKVFVENAKRVYKI